MNSGGVRRSTSTTLEFSTLLTLSPGRVGGGWRVDAKVLLRKALGVNLLLRSVVRPLLLRSKIAVGRLVDFAFFCTDQRNSQVTVTLVTVTWEKNADVDSSHTMVCSARRRRLSRVSQSRRPGVRGSGPGIAGAGPPSKYPSFAVFFPPIQLLPPGAMRDTLWFRYRCTNACLCITALPDRGISGNFAGRSRGV